jgi:TonB family protein
MRLLVAILLAMGCAVRSSPTHAGPPRATSCAGRPSTDTGLYDATQVTETPILRAAPRPHYPADVRAQGRVVLILIVTPDGRVDSSSVSVVQSVHPDLDASAVSWVLAASFWPGCMGTNPVHVRATIPVEYESRP